MRRLPYRGILTSLAELKFGRFYDVGSSGLLALPMAPQPQAAMVGHHGQSCTRWAPRPGEPSVYGITLRVQAPQRGRGRSLYCRTHRLLGARTNLFLRSRLSPPGRESTTPIAMGSGRNSQMPIHCGAGVDHPYCYGLWPEQSDAHTLREIFASFLLPAEVINHNVVHVFELREVCQAGFPVDGMVFLHIAQQEG